MMLCGECRKHYHLFNYLTCFYCLPDSKKQEIKEYQEFEQQMDQMMERIEAAYQAENRDEGGAQ